MAWMGLSRGRSKQGASLPCHSLACVQATLPLQAQSALARWERSSSLGQGRRAVLQHPESERAMAKPSGNSGTRMCRGPRAHACAHAIPGLPPSQPGDTAGSQAPWTKGEARARSHGRASQHVEPCCWWPRLLGACHCADFHSHRRGISGPRSCTVRKRRRRKSKEPLR